MSQTLTAEALVRFGTQVLQAQGVPEADAALLADSLVVAELWGHSSHGMLRLPWYVERLRSGAMVAKTTPSYPVDQGAVVVIDGHEGIGQVLARKAVQVGIERAQKFGVSAVAVRNSNHFGTVAYFTREAAEAGCVSFICTNASPSMPPWGGKAKALGNNPWSVAAPAGKYGVAVMDIANTAVARGKIYLAAERGQDIPAGWASDENGRPTTKAEEAIHGLILPMAGHKGYIISFMMDVLAGVLTGSRFGASVAGPYQAEKRSGCGHMLLTIDVAAMMPCADFEARMEVLIAEMKAVPRAEGIAEIFFPGELEDRHAERHRQLGIELAEQTWHSLAQLARETGVALPAIGH